MGLQPTLRPESEHTVIIATDAPCHITGDEGTTASDDSVTWPWG